MAEEAVERQDRWEMGDNLFVCHIGKFLYTSHLTTASNGHSDGGGLL